MIRTIAGALAAVLALLGPAAAVLLLLGLPARPTRPCAVQPHLDLAHRGDVTDHPPNTLGAIVDAAAGGGAELDVALLADDVVVVFHDEDTTRITGEPGLIADRDAAAVAALRTRTEIDGRTYAEREPVSTLAEVLQAACTAHPDAWVYIDLKTETSPFTTEWTTRMFERSLATWSASPCAAKTPTIFGVTNPIAAIELRAALDALDRDNVHMEMFFHPDTYPLGEAMWMQLELSPYLARPDILGAHYTVWQAHPDLARRYASQGFCLAAYGGGRTELGALEVADNLHFRTLDLPEGHVHQGDNFTPGGVTYSAAWTPWWVLLAASVVWTLGLGGAAAGLLIRRR